MDELYRNVPQCVESSFSFDFSIIEKALKNIHSKKINVKTQIDGALFSEVKRVYNQAIEIGYKPPKGETSDFLNELQHNTDVFAAFKVHRMGRDVASRLLDGDKLKSFSEFKKDTEDIVSHHVDQWLHTEYDTAIKRAQTAAEMRQFKKEQDVFPCLEWLPSTAINPRESHMPFYGRRWLQDDPFWDSHKPGDEWGCLCGLKASTEPPTDNKGLGKGITPSPGLGGNPAQTGQVFSLDHPYFPSNCNHCPFAGKQLSLFSNKVKDCYHCPNVVNAIQQSKIKDPLSEKVKQRRKEIREQAREQLIGRDFFSNDFAKPLSISNRGIKEWLNQPFFDIEAKNEALLQLDKLIENAKYLGHGNDKHDKTATAHIFETEIGRKTCWIIVREIDYAQIYSITDSEDILKIIKKKRL